MKTKNKKQTKQGISLIVLVITIIVMIILAAAIILSLSSNGIIDRANEAVDKTDLAQVKVQASTLWAEQYLRYKEGEITKAQIKNEVIKGLVASKIDITKYDIKANENGVEVEIYNVIEGSPIYFGVPYTTTEPGYSMSYIVYTDGSAEEYVENTIHGGMPEGTLTYEGVNVLMNGTPFVTVSEDGKTFTAYGMNFTLDTTWCPHSQVGAKDGIDVYEGAYCRVCGKTLELEHNSIIPEGGVYYVGVESSELGVYTNPKEVYEAGDEFPETVNDGDVYVYGDYEYRYNRIIDALNSYDYNYKWISDTVDGWGTRALRYNQYDYAPILKTINNVNVKALVFTFGWCNNISTLDNITIPNTVTNLKAMFSMCKGLKSVGNFVIPNKVNDISLMFSACDKLVDVSSLLIPSNIEAMIMTFYQCQEIKGSITINATPKEYNVCFRYTQITQILGECQNKEALLATKQI